MTFTRVMLYLSEEENTCFLPPSETSAAEFTSAYKERHWKQRNDTFGVLIASC